MYYLIRVPIILSYPPNLIYKLDLEHIQVENYRIKLPNDSRVDCSTLYKHVPISIGKSIFLGTWFSLICNFDIIFEKWTGYVLMRPKLMVKISMSVE